MWKGFQQQDASGPTRDGQAEPSASAPVPSVCQGLPKEVASGRHIASCSKNSPRKKAPKDTNDKCTSCSKVFCSRQALNAHVAKKHCADKVPIIFATYFCKRRSIFQKCTKCSMTFTRRNILKNHMKLHSTEGMLQNFPCATCSKKFTSKNVLAKHMKVAHPPQVASFQCAVCDQKFPKIFLRRGASTST